MAMGPDPSMQIASDAASAKKLGIASIPVALCCCGPVGLVLGVMAMNKGNAVLQTIAQTGMGQQFAADASTGKTCGIVGIVLGVLGLIGGVISAIINIGAMSAQQ